MGSAGRIDIVANGPTFSRLVFGAWRLLDAVPRADSAAIARLIATAVDLGLTTFDHADIYGDYQVEAAFGDGFRQWGGDRSRLEIVTKCTIMKVDPARPATRVKYYDTTAAHIRASVDQSLRNLKTDYVDVLLLHRPDPLMDADETAAGLVEVVKAGKVRAVGVSNFTPSQIDLLQSRLPLPIVTNQIELSALRTAPLIDGTLDHAQLHRYAPMIWSPLGGGSLFAGQGEQEKRVRAAMERVGADLGVADLAVIALAWLLRHPARLIPVLGTMKPERLAVQKTALDVTLDRQHWFDIYEASLGRRIP